MGFSRKLEEIGQAMDEMTSQKDLADFLKNPENAQKVNGLVEDVRDALVHYQVHTLNTFTRIISNVHCRRHYDWTSTPRVVNRS